MRMERYKMSYDSHINVWCVIQVVYVCLHYSDLNILCSNRSQTQCQMSHYKAVSPHTAVSIALIRIRGACCIKNAISMLIPCSNSHHNWGSPPQDCWIDTRHVLPPVGLMMPLTSTQHWREFCRCSKSVRTCQYTGFTNTARLQQRKEDTF